MMNTIDRIMDARDSWIPAFVRMAGRGGRVWLSQADGTPGNDAAANRLSTLQSPDAVLSL